MKASNVNLYKFDIPELRYRDYETEDAIVIYSGRNSKLGLGNPYSKDDRDTNIKNHKKLFGRTDQFNKVLDDLVVRARGTGKNVIFKCFCSPKACHTDIYVEYVNKELGNAI